jgi:hypothetical protein
MDRAVAIVLSLVISAMRVTALYGIGNAARKAENRKQRYSKFLHVVTPRSGDVA